MLLRPADGCLLCGRSVVVGGAQRASPAVARAWIAVTEGESEPPALVVARIWVAYRPISRPDLARLTKSPSTVDFVSHVVRTLSLDARTTPRAPQDTRTERPCSSANAEQRPQHLHLPLVGPRGVELLPVAVGRP